jgi:hypothetical protein
VPRRFNAKSEGKAQKAHNGVRRDHVVGEFTADIVCFFTEAQKNTPFAALRRAKRTNAAEELQDGWYNRFERNVLRFTNYADFFLRLLRLKTHCRACALSSNHHTVAIARKVNVMAASSESFNNNNYNTSYRCLQ